HAGLRRRTTRKVARSSPRWCLASAGCPSASSRLRAILHWLLSDAPTLRRADGHAPATFSLLLSPAAKIRRVAGHDLPAAGVAPQSSAPVQPQTFSPRDGEVLSS